MTADTPPAETFLQRQLRKKAEREAAERPAPQTSGANAFRCIAIEREATYLPLIVARLTKPIQPDLFGGAA